MKKLMIGLVAALGLVAGVHASEGGIPWDKAPNKTNDMAALQNGAKLFVNYCLNCHSAAYMRYNRLKDIGLTEQQIKDNLLFSTDKIGDTMKANIDPKQAKEWFGGLPPDLTVIARSRADMSKGAGADYLYTLLRTYYRDAVAMEILDGEAEVLAAGGWRNFTEGRHELKPTANAARNLPAGRFLLTREAQRVRLEWQPERGRKMAREIKLP